jgi:preprotein translocase subunit SecE
MNRLANYLKEARAELMRVTWPTRSQAIQLTISVIVFSVFFAVIIGILDYGFSQFLQKVILKG